MKKIVVISAIFVIIGNVALVNSSSSLETSSTTIRGEYRCLGNPCFTEECIPGMIWAVISDDTIYYLVGRCGWVWDCENVPWTFGYKPKEGANVVVIGQVYEEQDVVWNRPYNNIKVEYLLPEICPVEAIYGSDSTETELLRSIRDNILSKTQEGRELIKMYYQWSPVIVRAMEVDEELKEDIKEMVEGILGVVE